MWLLHIRKKISYSLRASKLPYDSNLGTRIRRQCALLFNFEGYRLSIWDLRRAAGRGRSHRVRLNVCIEKDPLHHRSSLFGGLDRLWLWIGALAMGGLHTVCNSKLESAMRPERLLAQTQRIHTLSRRLPVHQPRVEGRLSQIRAKDCGSASGWE
jgi:hypothetical protein